MQAQVALKTYAALVDARLDQLLPPISAAPARLHEAMRYACLAPGKRLRPGLVLAAAEAIGAPVDAALDAACAVEFVHCFSLIHDDLPAIDNDSLRRGRPTLHVEFGEGLALLAGDALFGLAFETIHAVPGEPARVLAAARVLSNASGSAGLVGGEVDDILAEGSVASLEQVRSIHARKTGALIAASCRLGGVLAGATDTQRESLTEFGSAIGLAFQIVDDILNATSTPERLGKAAGSDGARGKATYPAVIGVEGARAAANDCCRLAIESIEDLPNPETLRSIAQFTLERLH